MNLVLSCYRFYWWNIGHLVPAWVGVATHELAAAGTAGVGNVFFDLVALLRWNQFSFAFDMPCLSTAFPACRSLFGLRWRVLRAIT